MRPQDHAAVILRKSISIVNHWNIEAIQDKTIEVLKKDSEIDWWVSKDVALLVADEVISQWEYIDTYLADMNGELNPNLRYWYKVRKYINNF